LLFNEAVSANEITQDLMTRADRY